MSTKNKATSAGAKMAGAQVNEAVAAGKQAIEDAVKNSTAGYEQAIEMTREQLDKSSAAVLGGYEDIADLNKQNVEALTQASDVLAKGAESAGRAYLDYLQGVTEAGAEATMTFMSAKTVKDVADAQSAYARASFNSFLAESARISEMNMKTVNDAFGPLRTRFGTVFGKPWNTFSS